MLEAILDDHTTANREAGMYRAYVDGQHRTKYATPAFRNKYDWIIQAGVVNLVPRIVSNFADLVAVDSWTGPDADAAANWVVETDFTDTLDLAVREALTTGDAYLNVWPSVDGDQQVWFHQATQAGYVPSIDDPTEPAVFYQRWDEVETVNHLRYATGRLNVYYPDGTVERWVTDRKQTETTDQMFGTVASWYPYDADGTPDTYRIDTDGFTWNHIAFDPATQGGHGRSLVRDAIPLQDGLNHAYHALIVSTERYASSLRFLLGYEPAQEYNPETGKVENESLHVDETRNTLIGVKGENVRLAEYTQQSPDGLIKVMETLGTWMARTVGMPVTDLIPDIGNIPSGAALRLLSASRSATVRNFTDQLTGPVTRVMNLAGFDASPVWADPSPHDESEEWEQAVLRDQLGVPFAQNMRELGYTADEIEAMAMEQADMNATIGAQLRRDYMAGA